MKWKGKKMEECVRAVKQKDGARNPWAICTAQAKKDTRYRKKGYSRWR